MNVNTKLALLDRVRKYLNQDVTLPAKLDGADVLYRLTVEENAVRIEGFLPDQRMCVMPANADKLNARAEQNNGVLWVAAMNVAWDDYVLADGPYTTLVKLSNQLRCTRYEDFIVKLDVPVFSRIIYGQLVDNLLVEEEVA